MIGRASERDSHVTENYILGSGGFVMRHRDLGGAISVKTPASIADVPRHRVSIDAPDG